MIEITKIKTKDIAKESIKSIDKTVVGLEKTKDNIVNIKEKTENAYKSDNDNNATEYASNKIDNVKNTITRKAIKDYNKRGIKATKETTENVKKIKRKIKNIKTKLAERKNIKKAQKAVKTTKQVTEKAAKETVKNVERGRKLAKESTKRTTQSIKAAAKVTIVTIKGIIAALKSLITFLIAGGWIVIIIVVVICLVGLLLSSIFGIFFSSENTGANTISMNTVISEINKEMATKIKEIENNNPHDNYKIESDRASWKDILIVYVATISKGTNETDVITIDNYKIEQLKKIFWDMNTITYEIKQEPKDSTLYEGQQDSTIENVLYIKISSKTPEDMIDIYGFNPLQVEQMEELQKEEYSSMWASVIFGSPIGSPNMVQIALEQVGNVGGEPYWSWYGFTSRVEWCACFVSWVANQAGIDETIIPKFSLVSTGVNFFKATGAWQDKGYSPQPGDIIFFDWENDGKPNHVGIVEKVENDEVYTIEGNSNDECKEKNYSISSNLIFGYGVPTY